MASVTNLPWDQSTFIGRLNYYARVTDPRLVFVTNATLNKAKHIILANQKGIKLPHVTKEEAIRARVIYNSAIHPDNGVRMNMIGRLSAYMPCATILAGALLTFYNPVRTMPQVIATQFVVQSYTATVNYTNRNAKSQTTGWQIATAYVGATSGAVFVSVGLNSLLVKAPILLKRWVPLAAVVAANCVNIPTMRQRELIDGIMVTDKDGNALGESRRAAAKGIGEVLISRIFLVTPAMLLVPTIIQVLERRSMLKSGRVFLICIQTLLSGFFMIVAVPIGCSLFPQQCSLRTDQLELSLQEDIKKKYDHPIPDRVYFNKGL
ncbi:sideroflexin-2-like [Dysidea avara]|uniref:sideroflexin-2-like n=1 Tax=Dysidea avara TaxID=196820 RepID=UPI0033325CEB